MIEHIRNYNQPNKNYHYNSLNKHNSNNNTAHNKTSNESRLDDHKANNNCTNNNNNAGAIKNIVLIARKIKS